MRITSTISMHEIGTAFFTEELRLPRLRSAWIITVAASVICVFCALSVGAADISVMGQSLMEFFDMLTANVMMPLGAVLSCLFVGWYVPRKVVYEEFTNGGTIGKRIFGVFIFAVRYVCPVCIALIFLHQLGVI